MKYEPTKLEIVLTCVFAMLFAILVAYGVAVERNRVPYTPSNTSVELTAEEEAAIVAEVDAEMAEVYRKLDISRIERLLDALTKKENPQGNPDLIGDQHMTNKAYGLLQIRYPYVADVNRIAGTSYTTNDMRDASRARWAAKVYLDFYGKQYTKETGQEPSAEVLARIHNGGPTGWKKTSTLNYWEDVQTYLNDK